MISQRYSRNFRVCVVVDYSHIVNDNANTVGQFLTLEDKKKMVKETKNNFQHCAKIACLRSR